MTELSKPVGLNSYCGPAVLAIMTGKSTDQCARVISQLTGQTVIKGVQYSILLQAFDRLGWSAQPKPRVARTLFGILSSIHNQDGNYLIEVPGHVVIIQVRNNRVFFCDNHTKEPIPAENSARLMQQVTQLHLLVEKPKIQEETKPLINPAPQPKQEPEERRVVCRKCMNTFWKTALASYQVTLRDIRGISVFNVDHLCPDCVKDVLSYLERLGDR